MKLLGGAFTKINNVKVKPVQHEAFDDKRPLRGHEMFSEFSNIFVASKKKSGKSFLLYNIIKHCSDPDTKIIAFVSTLNKDPTWKAIKRLCKDKGLDFQGETSINTSYGGDLLQDLIDDLDTMHPDEDEDDDVEVLQERKKLDKVMFGSASVERRKKKSRYKPLEYIIVFDDISDQIKRSPSLTALLKKNRHYHSHVIVSSQYYKDILPESREQLDALIVFKKMPDDVLKVAYNDTQVDVPFEKFKDIYKIATEEPYSFLYVDRVKDEFRIKFDTVIDPDKIV